MVYSTAQYSKLPHEQILELVSELEIWQRFYPFIPGKLYKSPLREDKKPSFSIFKGNNDRWNYKDLSTGDYGDVFSFLEKYLLLDYYTLCRTISTEFNLKLFKPVSGYTKVNTLQSHESVQNSPKTTKIDIVEKPFTEIELNYWKKKYGIEKEILDFYNVKSCHKIFINHILWRYSTVEVPIYAFTNPRTGKIKIYRPTSKYKTSKWRSTQTNEESIGGYDQLPESGDILIFQKGLKEVMCLYSMGYASCCTQGEGFSINPDFFRHLKGRFKRIILMYDNDEAGIINSKHLGKLHKLECIYTPEFKNITDYYEHYGREESIKLMKQLLKL